MSKETFHQMTERHRAEIEALQAQCSHEVVKEVKWSEDGIHWVRTVRMCQLCGKVLHDPMMQNILTIETLDKSERGEDVHEVGSVDELISELNSED